MNQWLNRSHPPMLQIAVFLCYWQAIMGLLGMIGLSTGPLADSRATFAFITVGLGVGGVGIANDRKWGWWLAVVAAAVQVLMFFVVLKVDNEPAPFVFLGTSLIISFIFDVALVGLLTHAQTREYQKIWFK